MDYTEFKYLFPPRPTKSVLPTSMKFMAKLGYGAQKKKNGTCTLIFTKGSEVRFKTRHLDIADGEHRSWAPNKKHNEFFGSLSPHWNVFAAELLHNKGPSVKNELFIFDQLVNDGISLVDTTFSERQGLLVDRWGKKFVDEGDQFRIHEHITIARTFLTGFADLYSNLGPLDEGLVFKFMRGKLAPCVKETSNTDWQSKCRIPQRNYSF